MALIPTDPKQQKALIAGVAAIAVLYFANSFWLDKKREVIEADQATLEQLEASNRSAQLLITQGGRGLEERMALYERHIAQLELLIPGQEQLALLISDITSLARSEGVEIKSLSPDGSEPVGSYTKETYAWSASGEYHDIARFLSKVASMERIVTPVDMDIQLFTGQVGSQQETQSPILATFRIQTYVIPDFAGDAALLPLPGGDQ
jgi:type IV pilus assembly protein PilO